MDIGGVDNSDDQFEEVTNVRRPRRDARILAQRCVDSAMQGRHGGRQNHKTAKSGKPGQLEGPEAEEDKPTGSDVLLLRERCTPNAHQAKLCTSPPDLAAQAVGEEGDTDEESSDEGGVCGVCGVDSESTLNNADDKCDDILQLARILRNTASGNGLWRSGTRSASKSLQPCESSTQRRGPRLSRAWRRMDQMDFKDRLMNGPLARSSCRWPRYYSWAP